MKGQKIVGKLNNNGHEYSFVMADFELTILYNGKDVITKEILVEDGFLRIESFDCKRFLIAAKDNISINDSVNITFDFYIECNNDYQGDRFTEITFCGGTINHIIAKNRLGIPQKKEAGMLEVPYDVNVKIAEYNIICDNLAAKLILNSKIDTVLDFNKGKMIIADGDKYLQLRFDFDLNVVIKNFNYMLRVFKILTYRDNVGDFRVFLFQNDKRAAECHYKSSNMYKSNKKRGESICLDWLTEEQINKLFTVVLGDDKNGFSIDFLPIDESLYNVSKDRIIHLVTGLESLLNIIQESFAKRHFGLIKSLKDLVEQDDELSKKEKGDICGQIDYINKALKDRTYEEIKKNKNLLEPILKSKKLDINNVDKIIADIIKYRNCHVHNDIGDLTPELANSSKLFDILIYCFLLKYIGLDDGKISLVLDRCIK